MTVHIHPTAIVSPNANLGEGVEIGPFCMIGDHVTIGDGTVIRPMVRLCQYVTVGKKCVVYESAIIGAEPQDMGFKGEESYVCIGDRTIIREHVTIHRGTGAGQRTTVGSDCLLMDSVHVGHNVSIGNNVIISSKSGLAGYVEVGEHTVIGGLAGFHQFLRIGEYCMVGGASKNVQDIPPFTLVDGHPSRVYGLNVVGLKRNGFSQEKRLLLRHAYQRIYHSGLPIRQAVEELAKNATDKDVLRIIEFFRSSNRGRGVCTWPKSRGHEQDR